jgi:hypothetical protein
MQGKNPVVTDKALPIDARTARTILFGNLTLK